MNAIDGTDHAAVTVDAPPPSLLTVIVDTNPYAWSQLLDTLPLSEAVGNLLVFINAHLAFNHANRVAVLASHTSKAEFLYPSKDATGDQANGTGSTPSNANKYPLFAAIERAVLLNLHNLISSTSPSALAQTNSTQIAGALTTALAHISKTQIQASPVQSTSYQTADTLDGAGRRIRNDGLSSRVLILSVSGDLSAQYIPLMNCIFAAQRSRIPIDICKLAGDTVFLQQACDATGGIYIAPERPEGLLQYLMMAFLPDDRARANLVMPGLGDEVDFRAACFCHRNIVDIGWVCSVCLSIFCEPLPDATCLTCASHLAINPTYLTSPAVIGRKKKKRKRPTGAGTPGASTPSGTPGPS